MNLEIFLILPLTLLITLTSHGSSIYKYRDDKGHWVYTDKKPFEKEFIKSETKTSDSIQKEPLVYLYKNNQLIVKNPFYGPIEFMAYTKKDKTPVYHRVISERKTEIIDIENNTGTKFLYKWILGKPTTTNTTHPYQLPFESKSKRLITQAFNGSFSHTDKSNLNAVDIELPIGTPIKAARKGIVIFTENNYVTSGTTDYFLDKANRILVLHNDGTYAVYAHLLQGSVIVNPGAKVKAGEIIARSGSSGYSTGPHLHFVIRKNIGLETVSVPFEFTDSNGITFTPEKGLLLSSG